MTEKELEGAKKLIENKEVKKGSYSYIGDSNITYADIKILLDYIKQLEEENQELKKALKEGVIATCETCEEFGICPHSYREYDCKNEVENLKNQQKEFVEWLEKEISSLEEESQMDCINSMLLYDVERDKRLYKRVLSKIKEKIEK